MPFSSRLFYTTVPGQQRNHSLRHPPPVQSRTELHPYLHPRAPHLRLFSGRGRGAG